MRNRTTAKEILANAIFFMFLVSCLLLALLPLHFEVFLYQCIAGSIGIVTCVFSVVCFAVCLIIDVIKERRIRKTQKELTPEQIKEQKQKMVADFRALADTLEREILNDEKAKE